jgi:hypothetical protein
MLKNLRLKLWLISKLIIQEKLKMEFFWILKIKNSEKNKYNVYKNGKIIKSGAANLNNFQKIFVDYCEKSEDN